MDGASGPLAIMIGLMALGFGGVAIFAGGGGVEGYRHVPHEIEGTPVELTIYDKVVGNTLRAVAIALWVVILALDFGFVLPAPGHEWLGKPVFWILPLIFAGNCLVRADEPMGARELLNKRLGALALVALALFVFYLLTPSLRSN